MIDYSRRRLLGYGGAMIVTASIGGKFVMQVAQAATVPVAVTPPVFAEPSDAFLSLSRTLTGYANPDRGLARRLYGELSKNHPDIDQASAQIATRLAANGTGPLVLADQPALAELYHQMLGGWYLGVIGTALAPRCIAFENIISYRVVEPSLSPPSYCAGQPNFWVIQPA
jgi:hypothetical protein